MSLLIFFLVNLDKLFAFLSTMDMFSSKFMAVMFSLLTQENTFRLRWLCLLDMIIIPSVGLVVRRLSLQRVVRGPTLVWAVDRHFHMSPQKFFFIQQKHFLVCCHTAVKIHTIWMLTWQEHTHAHTNMADLPAHSSRKYCWCIPRFRCIWSHPRSLGTPAVESHLAGIQHHLPTHRHTPFRSHDTAWCLQEENSFHSNVELLFKWWEKVTTRHLGSKGWTASGSWFPQFSGQCVRLVTSQGPPDGIGRR